MGKSIDRTWTGANQDKGWTVATDLHWYDHREGWISQGPMDGLYQPALKDGPIGSIEQPLLVPEGAAEKKG